MEPGIILVLLLQLVIVFFFTRSYYFRSSVTYGRIWGIYVPPTPEQKRDRTVQTIIFAVSFIAFIVSVVPSFIGLIGLMFTSFLLTLIYIAVWFGTIFLSAFLAQKHSIAKLIRYKNSFVLGELPFIQQVEAQMDECVRFVVSFEGIALINNMNYCYAVERYEDYQMGSLSVPQEVALVGMYFVQKYHNQFDFKVDMEVIPGQPGQMTTVVGTGGVGFAYTKGTKTQRIFRSYIFTRK